jgi:hypothetical protein
MLKALVLKLACIHPEDREWILQQLSPAEKSAVQPLLKEIQELGLAVDRDIVNTALAGLKQNDVISKANIYDVKNLDKFWLSVLMSENNQEGFHWMLNAEIAENSIAPLPVVPKKLLALVQDCAKRKIS